MNTPPKPILSRSVGNMVIALRRHLKILKENYSKVYNDRDPDYAGEIAAQLRILATGFRSNTPLLIELMDRTGIEIRVMAEIGPQDYDREKGMTLTEYMDILAVGLRISTGEFVEISRTNLVRSWAEKLGGAHEDWEIPEGFATVVSTNLHIGGTQAALGALRVIAETVINVGEHFLSIYDSRSKK